MLHCANQLSALLAVWQSRLISAELLSESKKLMNHNDYTNVDWESFETDHKSKFNGCLLCYFLLWFCLSSLGKCWLSWRHIHSHTSIIILVNDKDQIKQNKEMIISNFGKKKMIKCWYFFTKGVGASVDWLTLTWNSVTSSWLSPVSLLWHTKCLFQTSAINYSHPPCYTIQ